MNIFGNKVKKMLIDKGMTQKEVAEKMNISLTGFSGLINRDTVQLNKMQAIADALDCELVIELKPKTKTSE